MLKYVPTIGWAWGLSDFIFLDRNWEKDKSTITKGMNTLASYPSSVWLLLYAEGTRVSPEKLKASQNFAQQRNLPILKHHLTPRSKGFVHIMKHLDTSKVSNSWYWLVIGLNDIVGSNILESAIVFTPLFHSRSSIFMMQP